MTSAPPKGVPRPYPYHESVTHYELFEEMELSVNDDAVDGRGIHASSPNSSGACVSAFGKFYR